MAARLRAAEGQVADLTAIYDLFGVGSEAREIHILKRSIVNALRFTDMLHAVEPKYDAARALLTAVLKESDANIAAIEKAGGFVDAPPLAERIRMFLNGGAS